MDCLEGLKKLPDNSVHSIVTDPPYGLSFMGEKWDYDVPTVEIWKECLRVLKPGGHLLSFAGSRTYHRMAVNIEDAGFEIRDQIMWIYGSGFPKSLNVGKAIGKAAGANREALGTINRGDVEKAKKNGSGYLADPANRNNTKQFGYGVEEITAPATDEAKKWDGWGTALKPAHEPIVVARKPLIGTVAQNVLEYGTGAVNIEGCRVGTADTRAKTYWMTSKDIKGGGFGTGEMDYSREGVAGSACGRFPANIIHDGSDEVLANFTDSKGQQGDVKGTETSPLTKNCYGDMGKTLIATKKRGDSGSAARFFYCAKASKSERGDDNKHPTVKPLKLMRYLVRLVTCPNGIVLDPFGGSGTTALAAKAEGFNFILFEREAEYAEITRQRLGSDGQVETSSKEVHEVSVQSKADLLTWI